MKLLLGLAALAIACAPALGANDDPATVIETAAKYRREGNLRLAIELLEKACVGTTGCSPRMMGELGATYYEAHRLQDADIALREAYLRTDSPAERALFANDLGNLSATRGR